MLTFPFTGRLRDFGSFCWLSPTFFLLTPRTLLVNLFLSFSPSPLNPPYTTRERYLPIVFVFFFSYLLTQCHEKKYFRGRFFCFGFCLFENEWIRAFFVWSRNRHFCLLFWNWLYSSVHYNFFLFVCFSYVCNFYDFDFAVFDCVVEGLLK